MHLFDSNTPFLVLASFVLEPNPDHSAISQSSRPVVLAWERPVSDWRCNRSAKCAVASRSELFGSELVCCRLYCTFCRLARNLCNSEISLLKKRKLRHSRDCRYYAWRRVLHVVESIAQSSVIEVLWVFFSFEPTSWLRSFWKKQIRRWPPPPAYFPPSNFVVDAFWNEEMLFSKNTLQQILFFRETWILVWKNFLKKYYQFIRILQGISHLFAISKKNRFFSRNPTFVRSLVEKFSNSESCNFSESCNWQVKVENAHALSGWFSFHI